MRRITRRTVLQGVPGALAVLALAARVSRWRSWFRRPNLAASNAQESLIDVGLTLGPWKSPDGVGWSVVRRVLGSAPADAPRLGPDAARGLRDWLLGGDANTAKDLSALSAEQRSFLFWFVDALYSTDEALHAMTGEPTPGQCTGDVLRYTRPPVPS